MNGYQKTLFNLCGEAITKNAQLTMAKESTLSRHLENDVVSLYPQVHFQTIDGFGGALTESTAYMMSKLTPQARAEFLQHFFGKDGLDMRFLRVHMDSCDYSLSEYQAAEHYARDMIGNLNSGMPRWMDWNLLLDEHGGPRHVAGGGFTATCVAKEDGSWEKKLSAHYVAHIQMPAHTLSSLTFFC